MRTPKGTRLGFEGNGNIVTPVTFCAPRYAGRCHRCQMLLSPFLLLLLTTFTASAGTVYQGKVVKIADGDTLTLLVDNTQLKIRLSDIDTPERKQPFGTRAKQALSELAFGKQARVVEVTTDRYKRIVGGYLLTIQT